MPGMSKSVANYVNMHPEVFLSMTSLITSFTGVQKEVLLGLDPNELNRGSITLYDQNYNGRRPGNYMRQWDGKQLCWYPEMSDYPLRGNT